MGTRERTFPYQRLLPYPTESKDEAVTQLDGIIEHLFLAVRGGDLSGVFGLQSGYVFTYWTRALSNWLKLKFELPLDRRVKLISLYFDICLQATELSGIERYANILNQLTSNETVNELLRRNSPFGIEEWERYFNVLVKTVPAQFNKTFISRIGAKGFGVLSSLAYKLQIMPVDCDWEKYWDQILALVNGPTDYVCDTTVNLILVFVSQIPFNKPEQLGKILPMLFYIWGLVPENTAHEMQLLYSLATIAKSTIVLESVEIGEYGVFTEDQMRLIFSAFYRILTTGKTVGFNQSQAAFLQWLVVDSLSSDTKPHLMDMVESLIKAVEPYCHPSDPASSQVLAFITDFVDLFTTRCATEQSNEGGYLEKRKLSPEMCERFVKIIVEPLSYGLYSKSRTTAAYTLPAITKIAYVSPKIVVPFMLRAIYPSLQGLYTPHRTISSLSALAAITPILVRYPEYAFHLTSLIELSIPCIDANEPLRAFLAIRFIQIAATCVPFWQLGESSQLAQEHVTNIVLAMDLPDFEYPVYSLEDAAEVLKSSTTEFENIVLSLLDRVIVLLENLPEKANEIKNSLEYNLTFFIPYAMGSVFNSISPEILNKITDKLIDVIVNNPIHNSVDCVAHICLSLVSASPAVVFAKLFPILDMSIRYEITENGAGRNRSFESRDRNFIWYLSMLNMALSTDNGDILPFKDKIRDLIEFLRENTKGKSVFHVANTIHHTIASLVTTSCDDYGTIDPGTQATWQDWGPRVNLSKIELKWNVPSPQEVEFAIELYTTHVDISLKHLNELMDPEVSNTKTPTEFSDMVTNNLTYLRTLSSAIAVLLDPDYEDESVGDMPSECPSDDDDDVDAGTHELDSFEIEIAGDDDEIDTSLHQPCLKYKVNTFFTNKSDPLYIKLHDTRVKIGEKLLALLQELLKHHENDSQSLKSILSVIKVWFSDVGIEKSAKNDHYQKSLYATESRVFKIQGLRKTLFPRPTIARRAMVYHLQRMSYGTGMRMMSRLEKTLLLELVTCTLSIYPDIRQNAQAALYSTIKVFTRSRSLVYPRILQEISNAVRAGDLNRAESGVMFINYRSMMSVVRRQYKHILAFFRIIFAAIKADSQQLNLIAFTLAQRAVEDVRLPVSLEVDTSVQHQLRKESLDKLSDLREQNSQRRANALQQAQELVEFVTNYEVGDHWRTQALVLLVLNATITSPQQGYHEASLGILSRGTLSQNPTVRRLAQDILTVQMAKMVPKSLGNYDSNIYRLDYDDRRLESGLTVDSSEMIQELQNCENPKWFYDSKFMNPYLFIFSRTNSTGWLKWPPSAPMASADSSFELSLNDDDFQSLKAWAINIDKEWLSTYLRRSVVELKEDENDFQLMNGMVLRYIFVLVDCGFTSLEFDDVLEVLNKDCDFNDSHWHRVLSELFFSFCNAQPLFSVPSRTKTLNILSYIEEKIAKSMFGHDSLLFWISAIRSAGINLDPRRIVPAMKGVMGLELSSDSGTRESFTLSLRSELINSFSWKYPLNKDVLDNLCQNFGHPLDSIRKEVVRQLAILVQVYPKHLLQDMSSLDLKTGISNPADSLKYAQILEDILKKVEPNPEESNFIEKARAFCSFAQQLAEKPCFHTLTKALVERVIPNLFHLSNIRDDPELIKDLTVTFHVASIRNYPDEALSWVVEMVEHWVTGASWHQKIRALLFLQSFYSKNMFRFGPELEKILLQTIQKALFDAQAEVRELASHILMSWIMCESPKSRPTLINDIKARFSKKLISSNDLVQRHGAALGLGALIAAFPYETPLPSWIPPTLNTLSRYSTGGSIVSVSVKKIFSDFKRSRQDTWHLDQKMFDQDQLDNLEGVLFKNYFV